MNEREFAELAAGHALRALSAEDEARYAQALRAHPEWAAVADADAETAAALAEATAPVVPDAGLRAALLAQIAHTPQTVPTSQAAPISQTAPTSQTAPESIVAGGDVDSDAVRQAGGAAERPGRRGGLRMLFALAACLIVLVGLGVGAVALNNQLNRPASVVALEQIEAAPDAEQASVPLDGGGTATVHWSTDLGAAVLIADGLEELSADETYQLWFVRGETPLPAGLFEPDAGEATALLDGEVQPGDVIAVTVEPSGGSPTGLPTGDPLFAIPTA